VKIGFYTALFPDLPIQSVAEWAAKENFDCLEVDFNRHIVDPAKTGQVVNTVRQVGLDVSSITLFGALLTSDRGQEQKIRDIAKELVVAAAAADVFASVFFSGRDQSRSETENYKSLAEFLAILEDCSASHPMKILLENWPGFHKNSIATTPEGWRTLFTFVNSTRIGLEFDPSHLLIQGIETGPAYSEVQDRVFLVHAKDAKLDPEKLQDEGYYGKWWNYRLPGQGDLDWGKFLSSLSRSGYSGPLIIEHEDLQYGFPNGDLQLRQEGLLRARQSLRDHLNQS
jgi:sugar phosphate isomerase/epimerase